VSWPTSVVVGRAYLDQLKRSKTVTGARADAMASTLDRAERVSARDRGAAAAVTELTALAADLEKEASAASGRDAARMRAMAETLKGRAAQLR